MSVGALQRPNGILVNLKGQLILPGKPASECPLLSLHIALYPWAVQKYFVPRSASRA